MSIVLVRATVAGGSGRATGGAGRGAGASAGSGSRALFPGASSTADRGCESVAELVGASGS